VIAFLKRIGRSVFFKLVLVFVATAVIMAFAVGSIVRYAADERVHRGLIGTNMAQYALYLADEIGSPPDLARAQDVADRLRLSVRVSSPDLRWSSRPAMPVRLREEFRPIRGFPGVAGALYRGRVAIRVQKQDLGYLFVFGRPGGLVPGRFDGEMALLIVLVVGVILALSYVAVRWLLQPLGWLTAGMQRMGRGDLDAKIPVRKHDELGELAATFNHMSERIRDLVAAKQQLLLDVSHELRSPMTRMKVAAEFIADERLKRRMSSDLDEMEAMTREILESERLASGQGGLNLEPADLVDLAGEIVASYAGSAPAVELTTAAAAPAMVDRERIRTLLRNLIDNALKYSGDGLRPVEVHVERSRDRVLITVEDFGEGIPERDLTLIFEPFYRVDKSRHRGSGGYGLGLSLCRKIVEAHGGSIDVESRVGEGSKFLLAFPLREKPA
jgi:signal transduction histidine kinase